MEPMADLSFNDFYKKITDTLPQIKSENVEYGDFLAEPLQFQNEWLQVVIIKQTEDNRLIPKDTLWTRWQKGDSITLNFQYLD
jgi:hypothetical protein